MNWLDDFLGAMNLIDRLEGAFFRLWYQDAGQHFAIPRSGPYTLNEVEALLRRYSIPIFGRTHDSKRMYFLVKRRQARWAEYVMLRAGVILDCPAVDRANAAYSHRHNGPPPAWADTHRKGGTP